MDAAEHRSTQSLPGGRSARAAGSASAVAASFGLEVDRVAVLSESTAVLLRLLPCDVVARVRPAAGAASVEAALRTAVLEVEVARQLERLGAPVVPLDHRVPAAPHLRGSCVTTFWAYRGARPAPPLGVAELAGALQRLHAALRGVAVVAPHVTDRAQRARRLVADPARTPRLAPADRDLLLEVLTKGADRVQRAGRDQLLHGEPHPGNVLVTEQGPVFIDWETCCRGPVEHDLAHAPAGVGEACPGVDRELLEECRLLGRALATSWRYDVEDRLPGGAALGEAWLADLRRAWRGR
ncbi:aminoglycoside phosphotransferase family protein [Quadrisphaera sp. KR29]|uniref:aminoglycoside phosphotransferase family protein n=1 Tax=Quadrisphaera sp. KR29 TaxID=3461391 RepID=UPI0040450006